LASISPSTFVRALEEKQIKQAPKKRKRKETSQQQHKSGTQDLNDDQ